MKSAKLYSTLLVVSVVASLFFLWQRKVEEKRLEMQRFFEDAEGVQIQVLRPGESPAASSKVLEKALSEFRRDIKNGYSPVKIIENSAENEIIMIRILPEGELQRAGALILDHELQLQPVLARLKPLNEELIVVLERLIFRLEHLTTPVFQDEAYRTSLSSAGKLWKRRSNLIADLDPFISEDLRNRQSAIRSQIDELQKQLRALSLFDTDARVPLIRRMHELRSELDSLSISPSPAAQALLRYPLLYLGRSEASSLFQIPGDDAQRRVQLDLFRRWLILEKSNLFDVISEDLKKNPTQQIEIRRRPL
jgi:hypothetical protein